MWGYFLFYFVEKTNKWAHQSTFIMRRVVLCPSLWGQVRIAPSHLIPHDPLTQITWLSQWLIEGHLLSAYFSWILGKKMKQPIRQQCELLCCLSWKQHPNKWGKEGRGKNVKEATFVCLLSASSSAAVQQKSAWSRTQRNATEDAWSVTRETA